jgi:FlaA1/EpsC-like NDP-sugar epimerase
MSAIGWVERCARGAAELPRTAKMSIAMGADVIAVPILLILAIAPSRASLADAANLPLVLYASACAAAVGAFWLMGMYRAVFRFIAYPNHTGVVGVALAVGLLAAASFLLLDAPIGANCVGIYGALLLLYLFVSRSVAREFLNYHRGGQRVVIYGAGSAGVQLLRSLREGGEYRPVAFVDADPTLHGRLVAGTKVWSPDALTSLIRKKGVKSVLLAMPSCTLGSRQRILSTLESLPVAVRTVPALSDIALGRATVSDLCDVEVGDLLGRDAVQPNFTLMRACIAGKVVMVTGAGGSIGAELCRQIVRLGPTHLVLLEMSEAALYQIERELRLQVQRESTGVEIVALLGKARHRHRLREILIRYSVQTIYHAAAYKHVPIVEQNIIEGVYNNVFSTWATAQAALDCRVETFVLISTDKAVNPTNVMGATKRLAELTLQALQERSTQTRFCMVRFGNVLDSSGSVVPLFREQITNGGPVTVTHRDVIRYFMTIPEAAQLVLQAGAMAKGGDVFVLNMSEPVRIADLAARMIRLMGRTVKDEKNPDGDIQIVYTGLRPAEKLFEELLIGKNVTPTEHPMIMRAMEHCLPWTQLLELLDELAAALETFDCDRALNVLTRGVAEYRPSADMHDLVWQGGVWQSGEVSHAHAARSNVAKFPAHARR